MSKANLYLQNARGILKKTPRESNIYTDVKPVREACGTAYLAVLESINEYLLSRGVTKKELPKSVEAYQKALRKYPGISRWASPKKLPSGSRRRAGHNGKLFREFDMLYDALHLAGYYRGWLSHVEVLKDIFNAAQHFINKLDK